MLNSGTVAGNKYTSIGGDAIGKVGAAGIYTGYTLAAGDDFIGGLDIVNYTNSLRKYFTTHIYYPGARSFGSPLDKSFDTDPYCTGVQDVNKAVPFVTDTMVQSASVLTLKSRIATQDETALANRRPILSSMIHTGNYLTVTPPCIIEAKCSFSGSPPQGWHPTFWVMNSNPLNTPQTGSPGWLEFDFPENSSAQSTANTNIHGSPGGTWSNTSTSITAVQGQGYKTFSLVITAASVLFYIDGVLVKTESKDGTITGNPYYILFTNHTYNASFGGDPNVSTAAWTAAGNAGATMSIDWYKVWIPSANYPAKITKPLAIPPTGTKVDYGTSVNYTFPTASALWGSAISDYCQAVRKEDFEPGANTESSGNYTTQFPTGMTWNNGTRTLTGTPTAASPGRLHISAIPNVVGGVNFAWRDYIDVGPTIAETQFNFANGSEYNFDLYSYCNVGTLLPKTITVGALPNGLAYNGAGIITGTPTDNGTTSVTVGVTNASGQTYSKAVNFIVADPVALAIDASNTATGTAVTSQVISLTTTTTNQIIVLNVIMLGVAANVTTITATGLTFIKRSFNYWGAGNVNVSEVWYAIALGTFSGNITVNFTEATANRLAAFSVVGANTLAPWDGNVSVPANRSVNGAGTSLAPSSALSTSSTKSMLITQIRTTASAGGITPPTGFTSIASASSSPQGVAYKTYTSPQSGLSPSWSWVTGAQDNVGDWDVISGQ